MVVANWPGRRCDASGVTYLKSGPTGRLFTIMAPATRFDQWKQDGTFERINAALNQLDRKRVGRKAYPSALCIDAQSRSADAVKLHSMICQYRGMDVNKRVNGRKPEFVVDTNGRLWVVDVQAANEAQGPAAVPLIGTILWRAGERLEKVYGDQAASAVRL